MINHSRISILYWVVAFVVIGGYIVWSQIKLRQYQNALNVADKRIIHIADNYEFWKTLYLKHDGIFNPENLQNNTRNIEITRLQSSPSEVNSQSEQTYVMYYDEPYPKEKENLKKYYSETVLGNYFYIKTDSQERIIDMFWDKP